MLTANELRGVMAMMPAFATPDAGNIRATRTVAVDSLTTAVDRIIRDGVDIITTTGSFGEFHTLLLDEYQTIVRATTEAVDRRIPLFIGVAALNSREVVQRLKVIEDAGADGALVAVPYYFPSTVDNAVRFYHEIAEMFPRLAFMIYHNPALHKITLPVGAFRRIIESPNIIGLKDSHRDTRQFLPLIEIIRGKIATFVHQAQMYPFVEMGAAGGWSYDAWMGPWPVLCLRDAVGSGDVAAAKEIILDMASLTVGGPTAPGLEWRETASKLAIQYAGYCDPGPLRPPFEIVPDDVREKAERFAAHWVSLCEKYRQRVRARPLAVA